MVVSSAAGLTITVTDGEGRVKGKSSNAKQGARQDQALSRMMVIDHSVRLRCPQDSMVLICSDGGDLHTCSGGGCFHGEGTWRLTRTKVRLRGLAVFVAAHGCTCCVRPGLKVDRGSQPLGVAG